MMGTGNAAQYQCIGFLVRFNLDQFVLISIAAGRQAANFRGGYLVTFACSPRECLA
jgi:hypothetical protein